MKKEIAFKDILKNLREENLAIFAGAGLSANSGFVQWSELLKPIAEELDLEIELETDYVSLAQYHENKYKNRSKINEILISEFSRDAKLTENHKILSRLPISTFWTTNYDKLIEKSLEFEGKVPDIKYTIEQLALTKPNRDATVYKMHGDVEHPNNAILTRDDYESYYKKMEPFLSGLAGDLVSKTFLFIGFSFTDPNLDYILSRVRNAYEETQRRHYCFMRKVKEDQYKDKPEFEYKQKKQEYFIEDLKRFSIETILIDEFDEITEFLYKLEQEINRKTLFISGSAHEYGNFGRDTAEQLIHKLSGSLIDRGLKIVSGFGLGIGSAVVSGALESIMKDYNNKSKESLILRPFPQNESGKEFWTEYRKDMINHSGIAIFLFGNKMEDEQIVSANGMWEEFKIAKEKGLLIIPIGATGYTAKEIHNEVLENFEDYYPGYDDDLYKLMEELGDDRLYPEELLDKLMRFLKEIT